MENKAQIYTSRETVDMLKKMAASKGVSMGLFIQKLLEYVHLNNIDYSSELGGVNIRKEIDRVVKILRAFENSYFAPASLNLKMLTEHLALIENDEIISEELITENSNNDILNEELMGVKRKVKLLSERVRWIIEEKGKMDRKGGMMIELTAQEVLMYKEIIKE